MRITLTLDDALGMKLKRMAGEQGLSLNKTVNRALAVGLDHLVTLPKPKPYRTRPRPLGLRHGLSYDDVAGLLAFAEGDTHR